MLDDSDNIRATAPGATPGLSHSWILSRLDRTGLPSSLLGFLCFLALAFLGIVLLIFSRVPDPAMYRNSIAFTAIVSFLVTFYFRMGRGWYQDLLHFLEFDPNVHSALDYLEPRRFIVQLELVIAAMSAYVNLYLSGIALSEEASLFFILSLGLFYFIQFSTIMFCIDMVVRQLVSLVEIAKVIRVDLLETEFYSSLANAMYRFFGMYIAGLCVITLSFMVFTEGEYGAGQMLEIMAPWYLPGLFLMSLYLLPYNKFRKRVGVVKYLELNRVHEAIQGNFSLLKDSMIARDEGKLRTVDLLAYQDRIRAVREWPFTNRIRNLVLFGILPPLTWIIAAYIEIIIESAL